MSKYIDSDELLTIEHLYYSSFDDEFYVRKSDIENADAVEIVRCKDCKQMIKNFDELLRIKIRRTKEYYKDSESRFGEFSDITLDYKSRYEELKNLLHFVRHPKELDEYLKIYKGEKK